ncbi:3712_t:CDS:1, partial [Gigaspora rosea]
DHEKDKLIIVDTEVLSELDLLKNLYNKTKKEVELISSVVKILKKAAEVDNSFNDQNNILSDSLFASSNPKVQDYFSN